MQCKFNVCINCLTFYSSFRQSKSLAFASDDSQQFWTLELNKIVQRIRHDFEAFYGSMYQQMVTYYETKAVELETNVQKSVQYQQVDMEKFTVVQQKLHVEYEKIQATLTYEREVYAKLENTSGKGKFHFRIVFMFVILKSEIGSGS